MIMKIRSRLENLYKDTREFGLYIGLTNVLWPIIAHLPNTLMRNIMNKKERLVFSYLHMFLDGVLYQYQSVPSCAHYTPNAPVWVCWLQGEDQMPPIVAKCVESIRNHANGHPVEVLSLQNYTDYITVPDYIIKKYADGRIGNAHFADIIRTVLLAGHGGCWIDATMFVTKNLNEDIFRHPFYSCKFRSDSLYITRNMWSNFFIASQKDALTFRFVKDMFYEYLKKNDRFVDYFMMDYIIKLGYDCVPGIRHEIDELPFNNERVHELLKNLSSPYDDRFMNNLLLDTYLHKLNWRKNFSDFPEGSIGYNLLQS